MKAILEHGGVVTNPIGKTNESDFIRLYVFNMYLNAINESRTSAELILNVFEIEGILKYKKIENPFSSGFIKDGFIVWQEGAYEERNIFVECEADLEL